MNLHVKAEPLLRTPITSKNEFEGGHTPKPYSGNYEGFIGKVIIKSLRVRIDKNS